MCCFLLLGYCLSVLASGLLFVRRLIVVSCFLFLVLFNLVFVVCLLCVERCLLLGDCC